MQLERKQYADVDMVVEEFKEEIRAFMRGERPHPYRDNPDGTTAHLWVSQHHDSWSQARKVVFETLVIEPHGPGGASQFEVAVRMPGAATDGVVYDNLGIMPGYVASTRGLLPHGVDH